MPRSFSSCTLANVRLLPSISFRAHIALSLVGLLPLSSDMFFAYDCWWKGVWLLAGERYRLYGVGHEMGELAVRGVLGACWLWC